MISKPISEFMSLLLHDSSFLHDWQGYNGISEAAERKRRKMLGV